MERGGGARALTGVRCVRGKAGREKRVRARFSLSRLLSLLFTQEAEFTLNPVTLLEDMVVTIAASLRRARASITDEKSKGPFEAPGNA